MIENFKINNSLFVSRFVSFPTNYLFYISFESYDTYKSYDTIVQLDTYLELTRDVGCRVGTDV